MDILKLHYKSYKMKVMVNKMHILHCFIWIGAAYKWGDWKNFWRYYPTILFFILGSFIHGIIFYNFPLWFYLSPYISHNIINLIASLTIFPSTILLYLPYFPKTKKLSRQILYILKWCLLYILIELFFLSIGLIKYYNGWSIGWSLIHNLYQFPLLKLHDVKPGVAWIICSIILAFIMLIFKFPLSTIK